MAVKSKPKSKPESKAEPKSLMAVHDMPQGSDEWFAARLGMLTASNFQTALAEPRGENDRSMTRQQLLYRLAGEIITGMPAEETFKSRAMERGKEMEADAREDYTRRTGRTVKLVGFVTNFSGLKRCGASPDGFVGFDSGLETKTMRPDLMIPLLQKGARMLPEHRAQVHGNMLVCERDFWELKIFWPKMPDYTVTVQKDETYCKLLHEQIQLFNYERDKLVEQLRNMGAGR